METLFEIMTETIRRWCGRVLGRPLSARLSRTAILASPDLVREDAGKAALMLRERVTECTFLEAPLLKSVTEKNGWILLEPDSKVFDAYAQSLPRILPGERIKDSGAGYVDYRMDMLLRHPDAPFPDREPVKRAVLTASRASARHRWTPQDERVVLSMTHGLSSFDRLETEQNCSRAAKIILYERATMREALNDKDRPRKG